MGGTTGGDGTSGSVEARGLGVGVGSAECLGASGTEGAGVREVRWLTVFCDTEKSVISETSMSR